MLEFIARRYAASWNFLIDPKVPASWMNNKGHMMEDVLLLICDHKEVFASRIQSVANMQGIEPNRHAHNSLQLGVFTVEAFVEKRVFYGDIHGIRNAKNIWGNAIGGNCCLDGSDMRYLIHDDQRKKPDPPGKKYSGAWSDGCLIMPLEKLQELSKVLRQLGVSKSTLIPGRLEYARTLGGTMFRPALPQ